MKGCFVQIGYNMSVQYKVLHRFLDKNINGVFVFDRFVHMGNLDSSITPREGTGREAVTVQSFDYIKKMLSREYDTQWIKDLKLESYDIVFVGFVATHIIEFTQFCHHIKSHYKKPVIAGGGIASYFKEYLDYLIDTEIIDHYVIGPGEIPVLSLMEGVELPKVIVEKKMPKMYYPGYYPALEGDICDLYAARGCAFACNFCCEGSQPYKIVHTDKLKEWIERTYIDYGVTKFRISSAQFYTINIFKEFYEKIENLLGKISFDFGFFNPADVDIDVMKMIKNMKFNRISLGVECFSDRLLDLMGKRNTVADNIRSLELLIKHDVNYWPERMYGYPTESWPEFKETVKLFDKYESNWDSKYLAAAENVIDRIKYGKYPCYRLFLLKNTFRLLAHTEISNDEKLIKIDFYEGTKIVRSWYDLTDENEILFKKKLKALNDHF